MALLKAFQCSSAIAFQLLTTSTLLQLVASPKMSIELVPLPLPAKADHVKMAEFGREIKGVDLKSVTPAQFEQIRQALYKVGLFA